MMADLSALPSDLFLDCLNNVDVIDDFQALALHVNQLTFVVAHLLERIEILEAQHAGHYSDRSLSRG